VAVERPTYDLTIFKLHCGRLTLQIYTQGERVLRIEAVAHDTAELHGGRSLERFPRIVTELRGILERFTKALSGIDQCFISDQTLEQLPAPSQVGKTKVGGIDFNKARMRHVSEAVVALSASPGGFTASQLATRVRDYGESDYQSRQAAYDLKKLRGKSMVRRVGKTRHYEPTEAGLKALAALLVLRDKVIQPLLAASMETRPTHGAQNPTTLDNHYETIRAAMQGVFRELGLAA
jgi:hypothetical protein